MIEALELLVAYLLRVWPGLLLGAAMLLLARDRPRLRIVLYVALFILLRDAMTPLGLWSFGAAGFFWIRLHSNPWFLALFGVASLGFTLSLYHFDAANRPLLPLERRSSWQGLVLGMGGALLVVAPLALIYAGTPVAARGGGVPRAHLPAILIFALLGNLWEEALFRGYVYGLLARDHSPMQAGVASGVVFAFCHIFLAITVSDVGYPLLAFALWEGVIAGLVGAKHGVLPATLTHGGAIFLLTSGLM